MTRAVATTVQNFRSVCRQWRQFRKMSQLDLALAANISQRHISWLETGRSSPSRAMVIRLSDAMDIPLRERNILLQTAGFASAYRETTLSEPTMAPVLDALNHVLLHHEPLPAVVVDRFWNVKKKNRAADLLLGIDGDPDALLQRIGAEGEINLALLTLHPQGLRPYIKNWQQVAPAFIRRLQSEALASGDSKVREHFARYIELAGPIEDDSPAADPAADPANNNLLPVLPLELDIHGLHLSLFSVISTFGTPQDITTDELRIEAFYPTDSKTQQFFQSMA
jgi:transcriptional regulator with XRE-family HTH domain